MYGNRIEKIQKSNKKFEFTNVLIYLILVV